MPVIMKDFHQTALALLCTVICAGANIPSEQELQQRFDGLREGAPHEVIKENLEVIRAADEKAFPMLVRNLHRQEPASDSFQEAKVHRDEKTGEFVAVKPLLGHVAFMLLEMRFYEGIPKSHRGHEAFDSNTAEEWFRNRKSKSLVELQLDAARDSLVSAENENRRNPNEFNEMTVKFFADRVAELEMKMPIKNGAEMIPGD